MTGARNIGLPKLTQGAGINSSVAVKLESNIDAMLGQLAASVAGIDDVITRLAQKLSPVCDNRPVRCGDDTQQESAATCELAAEIERAALRANQLAVRLETLLCDVQL